LTRWITIPNGADADIHDIPFAIFSQNPFIHLLTFLEILQYQYFLMTDKNKNKFVFFSNFVIITF
jgi:hypothetical protein